MLPLTDTMIWDQHVVKLQLNHHSPQNSIDDIQPTVAWMRYIIIINTLRPG